MQEIPSNLSGIYQIRNTFNNKKYIGSSVNLRRRYREHFNTLINGTHYNSKIQRAFNKYDEKLK